MFESDIEEDLLGLIIPVSLTPFEAVDSLFEFRYCRYILVLVDSLGRGANVDFDY